jgi:hypothetical protein
MQQITGLTSDAKQNISMILEDGSIVKIDLFYSDNVKSWFFSISSGNFELTIFRLATSPNILFRFTNILNFGISVLSKMGQTLHLLTILRPKGL